jgi:phage terminase Nu1 subunit (DNA packaging protein)
LVGLQGRGFNSKGFRTVKKIMTANELCTWLDVSPRRLTDLVRRGTVVRLGFNKYDAPASTRSYIFALRQEAEARAGQDSGGPDLVSANAVLRGKQVELLQARYAKEAARLVVAEEGRRAWGEISAGITRFVLALPAKIAGGVPSLTDHDRARIAQLVSDGLTDCRLPAGLECFDRTVATRADSEPDDGQPTDEVLAP